MAFISWFTGSAMDIAVYSGRNMFLNGNVYVFLDDLSFKNEKEQT